LDSPLLLKEYPEIFQQGLKVLFMLDFVLKNLDGEVVGHGIFHPDLLDDAVIDIDGALFA